MAKAIVPTQAALPGVVENEIDTEIVSRFVRDINNERGFDSLTRLPSKDERSAMEQRRLTLHKKLTPISMSTTQRDDIRQALGLLWIRYPSLRNADVKGMADAYATDLEQFPLFAALTAIEDVIKNRIKGLDPDWPPASMRLEQAAEGHAAPWREAKYRVERVLAISQITPPSNPELKARLSIEIKSAFAGSKFSEKEALQRQEMIDRVTKRANDAREKWVLEEYRLAGIDPIMGPGGAISMSLAKQLGKLPQRKESR